MTCLHRSRCGCLLLLLVLLLSCCATSHDTAMVEPVFSDGSESPGVLSQGFCPSTGQVRLPVIPIGFPDQPFTDDMLVALKVALNSGVPGSKTSGGAAGSVSAFYKASSYGALELTFDVLPTVDMKLPSFMHQWLYRRNNAYTDLVLARAVKQLDKQVDFSRYDADEDGNLDGVILLYAVPEDAGSSNTFWWSWYNYTWRKDMVDGKMPLGYIWSSSSCLFSTSPFSNTEEIDPYVLIHEVGHLLGLEDYYDTDPLVGAPGDLGYFDMMDADFGDHCPFSKYQLGWVTPTVVTEGGIVELHDFSTTGETLLIPFGDFEGFGSEYVMLDLFSPGGLGVLAPYWFGIETPVVRAWHVDATVKPDMRLDQYENLDGFYLSNNSTTDHKLLCYIEADGDGSLEADDACAASSDFYSIGQSIEGITAYDGRPLPFTVRILSIKSGVARLEIKQTDTP